MVRLGASGVEVSLTGRGAVSALIATLLVISPFVGMPTEAQAATLMANDSFGSSNVGTVPGWTDSDGGAANASVTNSAPNLAGSPTAHHARVQNGQSITKTVSTVGYENIVLKYYWMGDADGDGASDTFKVQWKKTTDVSFTTASSTRLDVVTSWTAQQSITLPASANNTSIDIRFFGDSNATTEEARIDDVTVEGDVSAPSDTTAPVLAEVTPVTTPTNDPSPAYTFSSDEAGDISFGGSCSSATTVAVVGNNTLDLNVSDGVINDCTITVTDAATNASLPLSISAFTVDSTGPTATVSSSVIGATSLSPIPFQVTFNEGVGDFDETDITISNGTLVAFSFDAVDSMNYTFEVTPTLDGDVEVSVGTGVATDLLGNGNSSGSFTVEYDTTGPGVAIIDPLEDAFLTDSTPTIDFTYTGDTTIATCEMDGDDFDCLGMGDFTPVDPLDDGEHTFTITVEDALANQSMAEVNFTIDTTAPTVDFSSTATDPTNVSPISMTATFSESVTGLTEGEIDVTNGSVDSGSLMGSGDTYAFTVTPDADGEVLVNLTAGAAEDAVGNQSEAADEFSIEYDTTAPTLTIDDGPADGSTTGPDVEFLFTSDASNVECDVDSSGFVACDSTSNEELENLSDGSHTFTVRATDDAGNVTTAPSVTWTVDATGPEVTEVIAIPETPENGQPQVRVSVAEDVEIAFGGSCVSGLSTLSTGEHDIVFAALAPGVYSDCTITATDNFNNDGPTLTLTAFEVTEVSSGGGGSSRRSSPGGDGEVAGAETGPAGDLGTLITNLFGGNTEGAGAIGGETDGEIAGATTTDDGAELGGELPEEVKLAASAAGFDVSNPWVILLILIVLAGLGYWSWKSFKKA